MPCSLLKYLFVWHFVLYYTFSSAQSVFYQDTFHGGVTGGGGSTGAGSGSIYFELFIEAGSTVKKAFLFAGCDGRPDDIIITLNGLNYEFSLSNVVTSGFNSYFSTPEMSSVHYIDITNDINQLVSTYNLSIPPQQPINQQIYNPFYLLVIYENQALPQSAISIILNTTDVGPVITYETNNLLPIHTTNDVGFAMVGSHFCNDSTDGSFIYVNGTNLGIVGGADANTQSFFCAGTLGHFYYQNNQFYGLDDDVSNETVAGSDVIANIQSYVNDIDTQINIDFIHASPQLPNYAYSNPIWATFLTYTTPCDTFTATVSADTAVCANTPLQLQATGGQAYEWLPQVGLNCYNCPNPVFQHDSTINYTVRIWNTDSCSKVLPMRVRVLPPVISTAAVTNSECEQPTGSIALLPASGGTPPYSYSINNIPNGSNPNFTGLAPGIYTVQINDSGGCTWNDTLTVGKNTLAQAAFTATPATGFTPLIVQFTNQSTGAANATWFTNGHTANSWNYQHIYDQEGSYPVTLIVWNTDSLCSDTASFTVVAQTEMAIVVPTLWNIGMLPQYSLHTTNVKHLRFRLFDDIGRLIIDHELHEPVGQTEVPMSYADLTRPATAAYVYRIEATGLQGEQKVFTGKVVVVR